MRSRARLAFPRAVSAGVLYLLIWMLDGVDVEIIAVTTHRYLDTCVHGEVAAEPVHIGGHIRCRPNDPYVETSHVVHVHIIHEHRPEAGSRHSQPGTASAEPTMNSEDVAAVALDIA